MVTCSDVRLIREGDHFSGLQAADNAPDAGGLQIVDRPRQRARRPQRGVVRGGEDLDVHPVMFVLAQVIGPVGGHPVDRDERSVQHDEGVSGALGRTKRLIKGGGAIGEQGDGLADVASGGGRADAEPCGDLGECLTFAQVDQDK